jgi:molecular chaperone GrpE (heat shock protein)
MKTIDKNRQRMIQEEINYKEEMQRNITQAIDTMSAKILVKLIDSLNKVDDIYSNKLTEKQKEKEWDKIERLFQKEIQRNEKKH